MSDTTHQINLALRTAAGHARAASDALTAADRTYEMKMKSAGASVWEAWTLAVRAQPEYQGRKLDDRALERIYESTKPRPWWDKQLSAVKVEGKPANREWAKRTMQWHTDPDAARVRAAKNNALRAANHKKAKEKVEAQGKRRPQAGAPTTAEMSEFARTVKAVIEREGSAPKTPTDYGWDAVNELLDRVRRALNRPLNEVQLAEADALLRITAEGLEAL